MLEQRVSLAHDADHPRVSREWRAIHEDFARGWRVEPCDDSEELSLSDSARAEESHDLPLDVATTVDIADLGVHVAQDDLVAVGEVDMANLQKGIRVAHTTGAVRIVGARKHAI